MNNCTSTGRHQVVIVPGSHVVDRVIVVLNLHGLGKNDHLVSERSSGRRQPLLFPGRARELYIQYHAVMECGIYFCGFLCTDFVASHLQMQLLMRLYV